MNFAKKSFLMLTVLVACVTIYGYEERPRKNRHYRRKARVERVYYPENQYYYETVTNYYPERTRKFVYDFDNGLFMVESSPYVQYVEERVKTPFFEVVSTTPVVVHAPLVKKTRVYREAHPLEVFGHFITAIGSLASLFQ